MQQNPTKRPHKIVTIGLGGIGTEVDRLLIEHSAADHIVGWNRSEPKEEKNKIDGRNFARDQARIALRDINGKEGKTSHFTYEFGDQVLPDVVRDANIIVITMGGKRTLSADGTIQNRAALQMQNQAIIEKYAPIFAQSAPHATYIIATNPVDTMTQLFQEKSGIKPERIIGLGGELDRTRLVQAIANNLKRGHEYIEKAEVYGQHGANMVPTFNQIEILDVNGANPGKLSDMLSQEELEKIRAATVGGGEKLVELLKESDHVAPAAAIYKMIDHIGKGKPLVGSAYAEQDGVYIGRPVKFKPDGTYETLALPDLGSEQELWKKSLKACKDAMDKLPGRKADRQVG